jgi:hypothetical protein
VQFEGDPIVASHQSARSRSQRVEYSVEHAEGEYGIGHGHDVGVESRGWSDQNDDDIDAAAVAIAHRQTDPIPSFQPFFTLVEDAVTNEHHHPTVHYIFADDDSDMIAEAACRSLETLQPSTQRQRGGGGGGGGASSLGQGQSPSDKLHPEDEAAKEEGSRLPPVVAGVREHYLILDVQPQRRQPQPQDSTTATTAAQPPTYEVTSAQSFSGDWQVLRSTITTAPTIGDGPVGGDDDDDNTLMLRIEGRGNTPGDINPTPFGAGASEKETMEEMIERFQRRLDDIRQVMEATPVGADIAEGGGTAAVAAPVGDE